MFDNGTDLPSDKAGASVGGPVPWQVVDPPQPVWVHPGRLFPPTRVRWGKDCPIWIREAGLGLREPWPGLLHEWWRSEVGDWLCVVTVAPRIGSHGEHAAELTMLVPEAAARPRD